jgi:hypothetical protein
MDGMVTQNGHWIAMARICTSIKGSLGYISNKLFVLPASSAAA